ncbi:arylamine N-acetyltransferase family protein [Streptomyces sp. ME19-01-6]|uniref:arylamine N-acetyltransferase family protein n=1 Tax=Streptomyces sp. ME19-01-6 TaxID=3028686 RepID=UPI0029A3F153|nr:arylamine N-acetyltransferase [Streptomyces sp. ME19-01-6]MDX3233831.1 arylamine N-acetyltransferase [Streptomyces sp. ME19-01-6]
MATTAEDRSEWGIEKVDVPAYLNRIGYDGPTDPTLETLTGLQRAHMLSMPFENLDILFGRGVSLDLESIQDKMVSRGRGGYCHEHNLLFAAVLERLGFTLTRLLCRIRLGSTEVQSRSHSVLIVELGERRYLSDAGYGCLGPLEPIATVDGTVSQQDGWEYRIKQEGPATVLQMMNNGAWIDSLAFDTTLFHAVDFQMANHLSSTYPRSPMVTGLFAQRVVSTEAGPVRKALFGKTIQDFTTEGIADQRTLSTPELAPVLSDVIGIRLTDEDVKKIEGMD